MSSWFLYIYITTFNRGPIVITVSLLHSQTDPYTVICNDYSNCIVINKAYPYNSYVRTMNITASSKSRLPKAIWKAYETDWHYTMFSFEHFLEKPSLAWFLFMQNIIKIYIKKGSKERNIWIIFIIGSYYDFFGMVLCISS